MPIIASILLAVVAPVTADKATHSVTFTAHATDVGIGTTVEFAFIGPGSDRAYEAMFVTDASAAEIAKAFDEAEIPRGKPVSQTDCRFWPVGTYVTIEPDLSQFINDTTKCDDISIVYTGGARTDAGIPVANSETPEAIFALYSFGQSMLMLDGTLDQSAQYGRFTCCKKLQPGERLTFKISRDDSRQICSRKLTLKPEKIREAIESLKNDRSHSLDVLTDFSAALTVAEAQSAAKALSVVDSKAVRINGFSEGQFYYRGFLPDELWRDRNKRLMQPLEVHIDSTNVVYTIIDEDWNVEGVDPKLTPHDISLADVPKQFKGDSCLFFTKPDTKLGQVFEMMRKLPSGIRNWYVFID